MKIKLALLSFAILQGIYPFFLQLNFFMVNYGHLTKGTSKKTQSIS
jgi:hypothetical protein